MNFLNKNLSKYKKNGFASLSIVLMVSGILLSIVFVNSIEQGTFFDEAMKKIYREMNYYFAYSCLDQAYLMLSYDYFFAPTPDRPYTVKEFYCEILLVEGKGDEREVTVVGNYKDANVYRKGTIKISPHGSILESI